MARSFRNTLALLLIISVNLFAHAQEIQTYKGKFPLLGYENIYALEPEATYNYYEAEDYSRVFHGPISIRYHGDGSTNKVTRWGKIDGQFKDGFYDGEWTLINPVHSSKRNIDTYYTVTMKCNFKDGVLDGPLTITMTDRNNKTIVQASLNYENGELDGEIEYSTHLPEYPYITYEITGLSGQYSNGKPVGKWKYTYGREDKGIADFDANENYTIDSSTGQRKSGAKLELHNLLIWNRSIEHYFRFLNEVGNDKNKKFLELTYENRRNR